MSASHDDDNLVFEPNRNDRLAKRGFECVDEYGSVDHLLTLSLIYPSYIGAVIQFVPSPRFSTTIRIMMENLVIDSEIRSVRGRRYPICLFIQR